MYAIITHSVCCCCQLCISQFFLSLKLLLGPQILAKISHCIIIFTFILLSIVLIQILCYAPWLSVYIIPTVSCYSYSSQSDCIWAAIVYRMAFVLFLFHLLLISLSYCCSFPTMTILSQNLFISKFCLLLVLMLVFLRFSNSLFEFFILWTQMLSLCFLFVQTVILIDLGYLISVKLVKKYVINNYSYKYAALLITVTAIFFICAVLLNFYGYRLTSSLNDNKVQRQLSFCINWPNIACSILMFILLIVQLANTNTQSSLLTTVIVQFQISFWSFSAICSNSKCFLRMTDENNMKQQNAFVMIGSAILMILSTYGSVAGSTQKQTRLIQNQQQLISIGQNQNERTSVEIQNQQVWKSWYIQMFLVNVYVPQILSNWGTIRNLNQNGETIPTLWAYYTKITIMFLTTVLYLWTLVAPRLLPNRNFSFS